MLWTDELAWLAANDAAGAVGQHPFFNVHMPLRLYDSRTGVSQTEADTVGPIGVADGVSTGHAALNWLWPLSYGFALLTVEAKNGFRGLLRRDGLPVM